jgi:hypothetical protein
MFDQCTKWKSMKDWVDMNTIDSAMKNKLFRGMEFIFDHVDTSGLLENLFANFYKWNIVWCLWNNKLKKVKEK